MYWRLPAAKKNKISFSHLKNKLKDVKNGHIISEYQLLPSGSFSFVLNMNNEKETII